MKRAGCILLVMWDTCEALPITEEQRETLQTWIFARNSPQKVVFRSRIVLAAASGASNRSIARKQDVRVVIGNRPSALPIDLCRSGFIDPDHGAGILDNQNHVLDRPIA